MRTLLISGGAIDMEWAAGFLKLNHYDSVIAVDGGLSAANLLHVTPDMAVGDFDTVDPDILDDFEKSGRSRTIRLNPMKDDTDTQHAVQTAIDNGADEIHIIGGMGGRADHFMTNIYLLKMAYDKGVKAYMYDEINKIHIIDGKCKLKRDPVYNKYISFIQLESSALDVTMKGFVYNVEHYDFDTDREYRLGVSNEFVGEEAEITIGKGKLVVIEISKN